MYVVKAFDFESNQGVVTVNTDLDSDATSEYSKASTYSKGDRVKVIDTDDTFLATYKIYEALQAVSADTDPTLDVGTVSPGKGTYWKEVGTPNDLAWMNGSISDVSTKTSGSAVIEFTPNEPMNSICLAGVSCEEVNITVDSSSEGEVFNEDYSMISYVGIDSVYDWLFEPVVRKDRLAEFGIPPYADATVTITFSVTSGDSSVGVVVAGRQFYIGEMQFGSRFSFDDFTRISYVDELQRTVISPGNYSEEMRALVYVQSSRMESLRRVMADLRGFGTAWMGDLDDDGTLIFGFLKEMSINMKDYNGYFMNIEAGGQT